MTKQNWNFIVLECDNERNQPLKTKPFLILAFQSGAPGRGLKEREIEFAHEGETVTKKWWRATRALPSSGSGSLARSATRMVQPEECSVGSRRSVSTPGWFFLSSTSPPGIGGWGPRSMASLWFIGGHLHIKKKIILLGIVWFYNTNSANSVNKRN